MKTNIGLNFLIYREMFPFALLDASFLLADLRNRESMEGPICLRSFFTISRLAFFSKTSGVHELIVF